VIAGNTILSSCLLQSLFGSNPIALILASSSWTLCRWAFRRSRCSAHPNTFGPCLIRPARRIRPGSIRYISWRFWKFFCRIGYNYRSSLVIPIYRGRPMARHSAGPLGCHTRNVWSILILYARQ
jgi:hypothetical protein